MTVLDEELESDVVGEEFLPPQSPSAFDWEFRVMLIAAVWTLPGGLFGLMARLALPEGGPADLWLLGGAILGAVAGGLLEAEHWLE